jgi:hypothetical protein
LAAISYVSDAAETKIARSLTAHHDENLSGGISWLTFLMLSSASKRVKQCGSQTNV